MRFQARSGLLVSVSVLVTLLSVVSNQASAQVTSAITCRGLSEDRCQKAIGLFQGALEESKSQYRMIRNVETWEITDPESLAEYARLRDRADGGYSNPITIPYAAFFADIAGGTVPMFPNHVLVSTDVVNPDEMKVDSIKMTFIAGFIEGVSAGHNMEASRTARARNTR